MLTFNRHNNVDAVLIRLLKRLKINISSDTIITELEKHPDYPSLLSISDVLSNFDIENSAYRIEKDQLQLITCPFLAHTNLKGGDYVMVNGVEKDYVTVSNENWNEHKLIRNEFSKIFNGVVLTIEHPDTNAVVKKPRAIPETIKYPLIIIAGVLIFLAGIGHAGYFANYTWQVLLLTILKTTGLVTSILLFIQSIDSNNPLIQKLCKGGGSTDCKTILSSKAAKVLRGFPGARLAFIILPAHGSRYSFRVILPLFCRYWPS